MAKGPRMTADRYHFTVTLGGCTSASACPSSTVSLMTVEPCFFRSRFGARLRSARGIDLIGSEGVNHFRRAAHGDIHRARYAGAPWQPDDLDRAILEFGFTQSTGYRDTDVGRRRPDVASPNRSGIDGNAPAVNARAEPRDVERGEARELHHLHDAHWSAHGQRGRIDVRVTLDHVAFCRLPGDGSLQWDLPRHDVFPLQVDTGRIDDGDRRLGREREDFWRRN